MNEFVYDANDAGPQRGNRPRRLFKGGGTSTTTTGVAPELRGLASAYATRAQEVANNPFQAYGGQRFAGLSGDQNAGMDLIRQRALGGSPVMDQANQTLMGNLNGSNPALGTMSSLMQGGQTNPYLDQMVNSAQESVARNFNLMQKPQMETAMVKSGSFGNSGLQQMQQEQQRAAASQMGNIATQMYGGAYDQDRSRQLQAAGMYGNMQQQALGMAPAFGNQQYQDAAQLLNAGNLQQGQQQKGLDFAYDQFTDAQNQPYKNLQVMGAPFSAGLGTISSTKGGGK